MIKIHMDFSSIHSIPCLNPFNMVTPNRWKGQRHQPSRIEHQASTNITNIRTTIIMFNANMIIIYDDDDTIQNYKLNAPNMTHDLLIIFHFRWHWFVTRKNLLQTHKIKSCVSQHQYNTIQYNTTQYNTIQYNTTIISY